MPCCQGILPQVRRRAYNFIYPEAVILLLLKLMVFPVAVHHVRIEGEFVRSFPRTVFSHPPVFFYARSRHSAHLSAPSFLSWLSNTELLLVESSANTVLLIQGYRSAGPVEDQEPAEGLNLAATAASAAPSILLRPQLQAQALPLQVLVSSVLCFCFLSTHLCSLQSSSFERCPSQHFNPCNLHLQHSRLYIRSPIYFYN